MVEENGAMEEENRMARKFGTRLVPEARSYNYVSVTTDDRAIWRQTVIFPHQH